jgi:5,10-methylenetetrahydrofolate reductase
MAGKEVPPAMEASTKQQIMDLLTGFSIEMTPRESAGIASLADYLPKGTTVDITHITSADLPRVVDAVKAIRAEGFNPVPHLAARSFTGGTQLEAYLQRLQVTGNLEEVFLIAGDTSRPAGEFHSSLQILQTRLLEKYGIRRVGIAGYPEGHPSIDDSALLDALTQKHVLSQVTGIQMYIVTQFCLDPERIFEWERLLQRTEITLPVHVGLPGVTTLKKLIKFAKICGIGASGRMLMRHARSVAKLATIATPDSLITAIAKHRRVDSRCQIQRIHFYPFSGLMHTTNWLHFVQRGEFTLRANSEGFDVPN